MRKLIRVLAATTALTAAFPAFAQDAQADGAEADSGDIIVSARRERENVQDVPVSVRVVTGETLQKLSITDVRDLSKLAPGLNIQTTPGGGSPQMVLRGIRWTDQSGTPVIPIYVNEAPFGPTNVLQSMYDIGQIEVLRGPQGTARGAPSIPGAITITTRRPNLTEFGGYVFAQYGEANHVTMNGALNIPLIADKLAVRIAGNYDRSDANRVYSLNNSKDPFVKLGSARISLRYEPSDTLKFDVMYQYTDLKASTYDQVAGTGSPGFTTVAALNPLATLVVPANYNSPALRPDQFRSVETLPNTSHSKVQRLTANATWEVAGHNLSYIFGYERTKADTSFTTTDVGNMVIGSERQNLVASTPNNAYTHELRLSSIRGDHFIDYDFGAFYRKTGGKFATNFYSRLPGAFGAPFFAPSSPFVSNPAIVERYTLPINLNIDLQEKNYSFYGNVQLHLPGDIELSGGLRWMHDERPFILKGTYGASALTTVPDFFLPAPCALVGGVASPYYPGYCDISPALGGPLPSLDDSYLQKFTPVIYNVSLSHKFSPNLLVYATVGSSYRVGIPNTGTYVNDPRLISSRPEYATSFEIGMKSTLLDGKLRFNADIFMINYKDQITFFAKVPYYNVTKTPAANPDQSGNFASNINSRVQGIEVEIGAQPFRNFSLDANLSYAKITSRGGVLPCTTTVGRPALTLANQMNFCPAVSGTVLNPSPEFQASMNGNYVVPLGSFDGYFRFIVNHQGSSKNIGTSDVATKAYTLVDLFAGLTGNSGGWDLGVYAKNVFNQHVVLRQEAVISAESVEFGPSGLNQIRVTQPREIGVTLRYAFGSR